LTERSIYADLGTTLVKYPESPNRHDGKENVEFELKYSLEGGKIPQSTKKKK